MSVQSPDELRPPEKSHGHNPLFCTLLCCFQSLGTHRKNRVLLAVLARLEAIFLLGLGLDPRLSIIRANASKRARGVRVCFGSAFGLAR